MRVQCDVCENAMAEVICCADEAALCLACDQRVHAANKLASKHQRLRLRNNAVASSLPLCDICQEKSALIFCLEDRAVVCRDCDISIHASKTLAANHQRFLTTGVRVALDPDQGSVQALEPASRPPLLPNHGSCGISAPSASSKSIGSAASKTSAASVASFQVSKIKDVDVMPPPAQPKMKDNSSKAPDKKSAGKPGPDSLKQSHDWQISDVMNFPDLGVPYGLSDMKGDWMAEDWMAVLDEHFCVESLAQVPEMSPISSQVQRTDVGFKSKYEPDFGLVPNFDDASVVPDIGSYLGHVPMKRQKMTPGL